MSTEELQARYDELDNIISSLGILIDYEIKTYEDLREQLEVIKHDAEKELEEIEPELQKARDEEEKVLEKEYWDSQF